MNWKSLIPLSDRQERIIKNRNQRNETRNCKQKTFSQDNTSIFTIVSGPKLPIVIHLKIGPSSRGGVFPSSKRGLNFVTQFQHIEHGKSDGISLLRLGYLSLSLSFSFLLHSLWRKMCLEWHCGEACVARNCSLLTSHVTELGNRSCSAVTSS